MASGMYERELLNTLHANGWVCMRAPSSGGGTERELPDVLAGKSVQDSLSDVWAIECKTIGGDNAYADQQEIVDLLKFTDEFGGQAFLSGRFKGHDTGKVHFLLRPEECRITPQGNYCVPKMDAKERASVLVDCKNDMVQILDEDLLPPEEGTERPEKNLTEWGE